MANSFFQFKQFRVNQEHCAMKVSTEACILGAGVVYSKPNRILDIGTGTGLLALMLAQKYDCIIDAVELDPNAAMQAKQNFDESPWRNRINLIHENIKDFESSTNKFDLIISNPPFFKASLKSKDKAKNMAIHDASLSKKLLLESIKRLLSKNGIAYVLLPEYESNELIKIASQIGLKSKNYMVIRNKPQGKVFRKIIALGNISEVDESELNIRNVDEIYTPEFNALLIPYYLNI